MEHAKQKTQGEAIRRLLESTNDDPETRKAYDSSLFNQLTKIELEIQGIEPVKLMRLGQKEPNQNRPLLVALPTIMHKREFMASLYKLKNEWEGFNSLSITHDLTKEERQERRNLVREAKRKRRGDIKPKGVQNSGLSRELNNRMDSSKGQLDQKPTEPQEVSC